MNSIYMWSETKPKFNQGDRNCQSTKKHSSEERLWRPVCDDKNCQSAKPMCYDNKYQRKSEGTQSSLKWSVPQTACKQIRTQSELPRNNVHTMLPT